MWARVVLPNPGGPHNKYVLKVLVGNHISTIILKRQSFPLTSEIVKGGGQSFASIAPWDSNACSKIQTFAFFVHKSELLPRKWIWAIQFW